MGKILSGILGPVSGKIGGVVGARWKNVPYLRSHVVPGASNTDLQVAQRARFAYVVEAAKPFVGRVFNPYYDKFLPKESGFNRCVSENIPVSPANPPVSDLIVTDGPLYPGSALVGTYVSGTGTVTLVWGTELGVDGLATDVAIGWIRHRDTNLVQFGTDTTRSVGTMAISGAAWEGQTLEDLHCGVFFVKKSGLLVVKISRNLVAACVE